MTDHPTPYADLLPPLSTDEYAALVADIAANGLRVPVLVDVADGAVVDGHHRLRACADAGTEPTFQQARFDGPDEREAAALAMNLHRRNLSPEQRRAVRERQQAVYLRLRQAGRTQGQAAAYIGVPRETAKGWEADGGSDGESANASVPDLRVAVPRSEHPRIAERLDAGEPRDQVAADYGVTPRRVGQIAELHRAATRAPDPVETPGFPAGPFRTITIDPPWPIAKIERENHPAQGQALDYATMTPEDIEALPVPDLVDPRGAHVYLWVTHRFLPDGLRLLEAWGVRYECVLTWAKNVGMTPFSWMYDSELVLFGRAGRSLPLEVMGERVVFSAKATGHSVKPAAFYDKVRRVSPGPRIDLFARRDIDGFARWPEPDELAS